MSLKDDLKKSQQHQNDTKDSGGNGIRSMNIPKDAAFKPVVGKNKIDIIPFKAGKRNPTYKEGQFTYVLDYWVHKGIGTNNDNIVCLAKNFHKPCPICEEIEKMRADGRDYETEIKPLTAKRRVAYNVVAAGKDDDVKIFETSHFLFEKELIEGAMEDGEIVCFADLGDEGKTVVFKTSEEEFGKNKFFKFKNFSFEDRDETYPENFYKKAYVLDELLNVLSYENISSIFFGGGAVDDPDAEEFGEEGDEDEIPEPKKTASKKAAKKNVKDEGDESEDEDDESEDEDEKPASKKKASKKADSSEELSCPSGHKFKKDYDKFEDCDDCELWKKCME